MTTETVEAAPTAAPPKRARSKAILWNTLSSYSRDLVDAVTMIVLTPILIQTLGKAGFGLWSLIWAFVNWFALLDMGIGTSVVKFIADARGRGDIDGQRRAIATLFWVYAVLGGLLIAGIAGSVFLFNDLLAIPPEQSATASFVLIALGARSAACMPLGMFRGVLVGNQRMRVANAYKILAGVVYLVTAVVGLRYFPDLRFLALLNLFVGIAPMVAMMVHAKATLPGTSVHPRYFDKSLVKKLSSFSFYFMIIQVAGLIYTKVDAIIIQSVLSLEMVAVYTIAMRLAEKGQQFCSHLPKALTPIVAELHSAGEEKNQQAVWYLGTKLTVAFSVPLLLGLMVLARPLVLAWTGPELVDSAAALVWLAAAALVTVIHGNTVNVLSMAGHQRYLASAMIAGQLLNLGLSLVLIRYEGILGVAKATFISALPLQVLLIQRRANKVFGTSCWSFYWRTVAPCAIPTAILLGLFFGSRSYWEPGGLIGVAALEGIGAITFWAAFWAFGLSRRERVYFSEKVLSRLRKRRKATV